MAERTEMTIKLQVTPAQGLALQAMLEYWNALSSMGSSREIGFFVDGDGNFHPQATVNFENPMLELTDELRQKAACRRDSDGAPECFDFDAISWALRNIDNTPPTEDKK